MAIMHDCEHPPYSSNLKKEQTGKHYAHADYVIADVEDLWIQAPQYRCKNLEATTVYHRYIQNLTATLRKGFSCLA